MTRSIASTSRPMRRLYGCMHRKAAFLPTALPGCARSLIRPRPRLWADADLDVETTRHAGGLTQASTSPYLVTENKTWMAGPSSVKTGFALCPATTRFIESPPMSLEVYLAYIAACIALALLPGP